MDDSRDLRDLRDSRQTRLTGHLDSGDGSPLQNSPEGDQAGFQAGLDGPAAHSPLSGSFGKYLIERILGEGAMGTVYLATDQDLQRPVALKIPKFDGGSTAEVRERFFVEARAAAALRHTNLCPVYEVGELGGRCFLAMAYIDGRPLSDFVSPDHPLPTDQVATIVARLADGLAHAHARGVIHRDLKPSNVIIDAQRQPILTDFGLAWSPDGRRLISAQENGTVLVRRPGDRAELNSFEAHQGGVIWVGLNRRSGELISAGFDRTIRLWPFLNANQSR